MTPCTEQGTYLLRYRTDFLDEELTIGLRSERGKRRESQGLVLQRKLKKRKKRGEHCSTSTGATDERQRRMRSPLSLSFIHPSFDIAIDPAPRQKKSFTTPALLKFSVDRLSICPLSSVCCSCDTMLLAFLLLLLLCMIRGKRDKLLCGSYKGCLQNGREGEAMGGSHRASRKKKEKCSQWLVLGEG